MTLWLLMAAVLPLCDENAPLIQKRPDFSGRWVAEADYSAGRDGREAFCDGECVIEQNDRRLTVRRGRAGVVMTYRLDGTPVRTVSESNGHRTDITTTATWSGAALVIATKINRFPETRMTVSLEEGRLTVLGARRSFERRRTPTKVTYVKQSKAREDRRD